MSETEPPIYTDVEQDEALLARYVQGEVRAFSVLYQRHKAATFRYLLRQTRDAVLAEDLQQEVWSQVITHGKGFQPTAKFTTWLFTIARNKVIDHVRHLKVYNRVVEDTAELESEVACNHIIGSSAVDAEYESQRNRQAMKSCLNKLPVHLLEVFVLKEDANMTAAQIAQVVCASREATKSRLRYASQQLADCLRFKLGLTENQVMHNE
ncbi:sigma-70 family RNA polymerase sigma factor [Aliiglaciecola litoralis]|uniref:Sigma-70 family RNA polymerase sigma factor n=1 Tax=Aliiglaciecola litoralis TaxID=582857 RepID=A0ABP3WMD5_9ALTE